MSHPPPQPHLHVQDDGGYSDSGTSLGFGSDAEDWTDIDVSSSGRGSDESGSESEDDDRIAEYNLAQSSEWHAIVAATPTLAAEIPLGTASTTTLGETGTILPDITQPPLDQLSGVSDHGQDVATLSASPATGSTRQPSFDLQFPDPLESSLEGDNLLHELGRRSSSLRRELDDFVARQPPGSMNDSLLTQPDVSVYRSSKETAKPASPLPKTRSKLQVTYLGYAPALYKRETVTQALVAMAGPDIDTVFVEVCIDTPLNINVPSFFLHGLQTADLSSSVHSSYTSPYNPSIPTLALVFLNPPLPMPVIPTTLTNVRFLPVLMPTLGTSSSGSNSILSLSMSSLFDFAPPPSGARASQSILGRDRADIAEEEWVALSIPSSSVLVTRWNKTVVELADVESEEPVLARAIQGFTSPSKMVKEDEDDQRSTWVSALYVSYSIVSLQRSDLFISSAISLVALLLGSTLLSAGAPLNASQSTPSPIESLSPTQTPFWQSGIFTSLSSIFNASTSPSSPPLPVSTGLTPSVHKGYSLSVFSSSDPLKQMLSTASRSKKGASGHHCEHEEAGKDHLSWASKLVSHVPPPAPPSQTNHQHPPVFPIIQSADGEDGCISSEKSLGRVLVTSMRLSYDTFSKMIVKDLQELMDALEELFDALKAHTKNSFIGPVRETIIDPIHVNVVQPICESFTENVVDPLLTNVVEPLMTNFFDPIAAHLAIRHERAMHNGRNAFERVAKRHERAVKNAKAIGKNAKAFGRAMSEVMVWKLQGREVLNPPKVEKSMQAKEDVSKWAKVSQAASAKMGKTKVKTKKEKPVATGMSRRQRKAKKTKSSAGGRGRRVRT